MVELISRAMGCQLITISKKSRWNLMYTLKLIACIRTYYTTVVMSAHYGYVFFSQIDHVAWYG